MVVQTAQSSHVNRWYHWLFQNWFGYTSRCQHLLSYQVESRPTQNVWSAHFPQRTTLVTIYFCLRCFDQYKGEGGNNETECLLCMVRSVQSDGKSLDPQTFFFWGVSNDEMQPDEPEHECEMCLRLGVKAKKAAAIWIRLHCQVKMCQDCIDCHKALKLDTISSTSKTCKQHPEYDVTTYCYRDESGHCGKCERTRIGSAIHFTNNRTIPISDAATDLKEKLKTYMCDLESMQSLFCWTRGYIEFARTEAERNVHSQRKTNSCNKRTNCRPSW